MSVIDMIRGDLLASDAYVVAFGMNVEGINDGGFCGSVAAHLGENPFMKETPAGSLILHKTDQRRYIGMAIHSLESGGWEHSPKYIAECLASIGTLELIKQGWGVALPWPGTGVVGELQGAQPFDNLGAIARSHVRCEVWSL